MKSYWLLPVLLILVIKVYGQSTTDSIDGSAEKSILVFPVVLRSLETSWGFGGVAAVLFNGKKKDTSKRTSDVSLVALYTLRKQLVLAVSATLFSPAEKSILRFQTTYTYYPNRFWGLGNTTAFAAGEGYTQKQVFINPQVLTKINKKFYAGLTFQWQHTGPASYTKAGVFDREDIPGRYGGNSSGIGPIISWDTRNNAYSPDKGGFAELQYISFGRLLGGDFTFHLFNVDVRKYIAVAKKTVIGLQLVTGLGAGNIPLRQLEVLGGSDIMRGYYAGRYTDKCLVAYQLECRRFLFWRLGIVAFAAMGQVAPSLSQFNLDGFHESLGTGVRIQLSKKERLNLRLDYGFTLHSNGLYVQIREAF